MKNKIERYGRRFDQKAILAEMPILGQRQVLQSLSNFFVQHMSDQIQVTYVIEGSIDFTLDGCVYSVKKGDIIINKPGQVFGAINDTFPKSKSAFFKIDLEAVSEGWTKDEKENLWQGIQNIIIPHLSTGTDFYTIFLKILEEHRKPGSYSKIKCRSYFQQLVVMILEAHKAYLGSVNYKAQMAGDMLTQINKYVSENLHKKIYTKEMADLVGLSHSHFRYLFSLIFRTNPSDYLLRKRIEKAKELLRTSQSITDISYKLAFSSSQYFSNSFKKLTGMRPKEYRKAIQKLEDEVGPIYGDQESSEFMDKFYQ